VLQTSRFEVEGLSPTAMMDRNYEKEKAKPNREKKWQYPTSLLV
jgi:uncharacterized protein YgiM (DUF1202 family)